MPGSNSGDFLEHYLVDAWPLDDVEFTKGSGSVFGDGDLRSRDFQIECKDGYADGVTFRREWINKIQKASLLRGKMMLGVHRTIQGDVFAILKLEDFLGLIEELQELRDGS